MNWMWGDGLELLANLNITTPLSDTIPSHLISYPILLYSVPTHPIWPYPILSNSISHRKIWSSSYPILSYHILSHPIPDNPIQPISYHVSHLTNPILSYPILSWPNPSYSILFYPTLSDLISCCSSIPSHSILSLPISTYPISYHFMFLTAPFYPISSYSIPPYPISYHIMFLTCGSLRMSSSWSLILRPPKPTFT